MAKKLSYIWIIIASFSLGLPDLILAQGWEKYYGGTENEVGRAVVQTPDLGFLVLGSTTSYGNGGSDLYFLKTDQDGNKQWEKTLGGTADDWGYSLIGTNDGGYAVVAEMQSNDPAGHYLVKLDATAQEQWRQYLPGLYGKRIILSQASDDSYTIAGNNSGFDGIVFKKLDALGNEVWSTEPGDHNDTPLALTAHNDGGWLITGYAENTTGDPGFKEIFLLKTDAQGNQEWYRLYGSSGDDEIGLGVFPLAQGGYRLIGVDHSATARLYIIETNDVGIQTDVTTSIFLASGLYWSKVIQVAENRFAMAGWFWSTGSIHLQFFDEEANLSPLKSYTVNAYSPSDTLLVDLIPLSSSGGYALTGHYAADIFPSTTKDLALIKTDSLGNTYTSLVEGYVFADTDNSCSFDPDTEYGLNQWIIRAEMPQDTLFAVADSTGYFSFLSPNDTTLLTIFPPNGYWAACPAKDTFLFTPIPYDTLELEFPFSPLIDCPYLQVDIGTPYLRRCFPNIYTVNYVNQGNETAVDAYVEITLDSFLVLDESSITIPYHLLNASLIRFDVGNLPPMAGGSFSFYVEVSCDAELGVTHCTEAYIFPDTLCVPTDPVWDGSSIAITGYCEGDSVIIQMENVGNGNMTEPSYGFIGQDDLIVYIFEIQLEAGEDTLFVVYPDGATVHAEVQQSAGHPGASAPAANVESCGGTLSLGVVTQYPEDDADPFVSIDCQQNIGSFDPNDKQAFPRGLGPSHTITSGTDLEYFIRFQNTGTDTAFNVVIRDTLPHSLDVNSLQQGASSHHYELDILSPNILKFTFADIMLPDSNVNEAASHGFVKFRLKQRPGNIPGTVIANRAGIYFDFNEPVITAPVFHTIESPTQNLLYLDSTLICSGESYGGIPLFSDTVFYDTATFNYLQLTANHWVKVVRPITLTVDTAITSGNILLGQTITVPTTIIHTLPDENNCDSLIIYYNVDIISSTIIDGGEEWQVFPNPASHELYIQLPPQLTGLFDLKIMALDGRPVFQKRLNAKYEKGLLSIPIQQLTPGIYFVQLNTTSEAYTKRITKH